LLEIIFQDEKIDCWKNIYAKQTVLATRYSVMFEGDIMLICMHCKHLKNTDPLRYAFALLVTQMCLCMLKYVMLLQHI